MQVKNIIENILFENNFKKINLKKCRNLIKEK